MKKVKRPAQTGEWIKVDNATWNFDYENGDILQVKRAGINTVQVKMSDNTIRHLWSSEYVVLQGYRPFPFTRRQFITLFLLAAAVLILMIALSQIGGASWNV
jgi:hypothetical protein